MQILSSSTPREAAKIVKNQRAYNSHKISEIAKTPQKVAKIVKK